MNIIYSPATTRHWNPWSTNTHHSSMSSSMLIRMLRGTIHVARSRKWKHGGWKMRIGEKKVKNRSKLGALNPSTYDTFYVNNTQNTGLGHYLGIWKTLQYSGRKSVCFSINPMRYRTVNFLQMNLLTFSRIRSAKFACPRRVPTHQWSSPGSF